MLEDSTAPTPISPNRSGVRPDYEGLILQRGGEELELQKLTDRFTVRFQSIAALEALVAAVEPRSVQEIPEGNLLVFVVPSDRLEAALQIARQSPGVDFASHGYALTADPTTQIYLNDQITVQFAVHVDVATVESQLVVLGLDPMEELPGVAKAMVYRVSDLAAANPIKLANQLMRSPEILSAEPDVVVHIQKLYRPRDQLYNRQWYLQHSGGATLTGGSHISAEAAWDITRGVRSVVVAVTDDAFDLNHPDFQGQGKIVAPRDLKDRDFLPMPAVGNSGEDHGTAVAGVAIAEENGSGVVGVAPGCALMPIRTTGFINDDSINQIFEWAIANGAAIISCSWGASSMRFPLSLRQRAAITRAATDGRDGKGCVVIFASGNSNRPVSGEVVERGWPGNSPRGVTTWLGGFSAHPDVIAVSACTSLNQKAAYSNWGQHISVAAPSNNAPPNTYPRVSRSYPGVGVVTSDRLGNTGYDFGDFTPSFGGTSSACPVVAGVAALVLSINPYLTARDVKQILQQTADKIVDTSTDPQLGLRKGTYDRNGHSEWFGYGKVNAYRAVQEAKRRLPQALRVSRQLQVQNDTAISIPDNNPRGAYSLIQMSEGRAIRDVQVWVHIQHEFMGDVELSLITPQGQVILLQSRTLGRKQTLQATYNLQTVEKLSQLVNQSTRGTWRLWAVDQAKLNTGQIRGWQLTLGV